MAPALQQWMAVVLGLLLLRSEAIQVIYAMPLPAAEQDDLQSAPVCQNLAASRKGSGICSAAAALALGLLYNFFAPRLLAPVRH